MTLLEAMKRGMHGSSLLRFYHLARACLVKSETFFDAYDRVFARVFKGVEGAFDDVTEEVMKWLQDPKMTDWKFPFRSGYSAAGRVLKVGRDFPGGFKEGDRVSFPGNHASVPREHGLLGRPRPDRAKGLHRVLGLG